MSEHAVPPEAWHRLHPLTVVTELLRLAGQFAYVLVAALAARFLGASERFDDPFLLAVGGVGILIALLRYLSLRFAVWEGTLYIRRGVIFRQARAIPIDRIQNIDLKQNLLGRLTGVVDLRVETASGSGAEAELSVLSRAAAERLKAELAAQRTGPAAPEVGAQPRPPAPTGRASRSGRPRSATCCCSARRRTVPARSSAGSPASSSSSTGSRGSAPGPGRTPPTPCSG